MIEIELKYAIEDPEIIAKKLSSLKANIEKKRTHELSIMYDNPQELMQKTDGRIRARKSGENIEFCYKKPITREGIKKEIEYEVTVSNFEMLEKIINEMGFFEVSSYERYRTTYKINNSKITIDEYPFANYIEIEGDEKEITDIATSLHLKKNLTDSCDTLFNKWRHKRGLEQTNHMKFSNFDK